MNQQSEHLSDAQIEEYGSPASGAEPQTEEWVEKHLDDCPSCRGRVLHFQRTRFALLPDPKVNKVPTSNCPSEDDLSDLAAGLCPEPLARKLKAHVATCNHCGPLLQEYIEDFSGHFTPQEQSILNRLSSASPQWQQQTARKMLRQAKSPSSQDASAPDQPLENSPGPLHAASQMAASPAKSAKSSRRLSSWKWALLPASTVAALAIIWASYSNFTSLRSAERAVSAAYVERRTIEMRITQVGYAPFAPLPAVRGPGDSDSLYNRPNLLDAEAKVAKHQQHTGSLDPSWREVKGRLALLESAPASPAAAVTDFQKAQSLQNSIPLQIDLAVAYYEQEIRSDSPNFAKSLNLLLQVLKNPVLSREERPVVLFDLAIVYEKMQAWDLAISTWQQFLQVESNSDWRSEGRKRLELAQQRLQGQKKSTSKNSLSPSSLLTSPGNAAWDDTESYQDIAARKWLVSGVAEGASSYNQALQVLAGRILHKHGDPWWSDFLSSITAHDADAAAHLQSSVDSNFRGLYKKAAGEAKRAEVEFRKSHNTPGLLRARYERFYAYVRSLNSEDCESSADNLGSALASSPYAWLHVQYLLERAVCENYVGNIAASDRDLEVSQAIAAGRHYSLLELRVLGISASLKRQQHNFDQAWRQSLDGLKRYWQGPADLERLYQFYAGMELTAQKSDLIWAAEVLGRQAISILESQENESTDKVRLGAAYLLLADILVGEGEDALAERELNAANSLLDATKDEPTANRYKLIGKMRLAEFQLKRGDPAAALLSLESSRRLLDVHQPYFVSLDFYTTEGECRRQLNQTQAALGAYKSAIDIAERALSRIHDEGGRLDWIKESDRAYRGLVGLLLLQNKQKEALRWWEWYKARSTSPHSGYGAQPEQEVAAFPMPSYMADQVRVTYAVLPTGTQVWVSNSKGVSGAWISWKESDLRSAVDEFAEKCARPDSSLGSLRDAGRNLFDRLMEPIAHELAGSKMVVLETDRVLSELPFEVLLSSDGRYFGDEHALLYSPGIFEENRLRRRSRLGADLRLMLIDSGNGPGTPYLRGHADEKGAIKQLFPATRDVSSSLGREEIEQELSQSEAVHFIGHGATTPGGAGLLLNVSIPPLTAADFLPARLTRMQLAVLSACSSGRTDDNGLLDTTSLVHAFLAARVPTVVSSRWNVDSESTAKLMITFYDGLHSGEPPAIAMHAAIQKALLANTHPYFWAGFTVTGRSL